MQQSNTFIFLTDPYTSFLEKYDTVKPVCNDHLYNKN